MVRALQRAVVAVPVVLVPALGLEQGGFPPRAWVWAGALAAWAAAVALVVSDGPGALRRAWPWPAAAAALLVWTILSAAWSARPTQTVLEARRTVLYCAVVVALLALARREGARLLVPATYAAVTALVLYALARYLAGGRRAIEFEGHLLNRPLGYANALGVLASLGLLLGAGVAAGTVRPVRAAAAASVPPLALALELTGSRASWLALAAGLVVALVASPRPQRLLAAVVASGAPAGVAVAVGAASGLAGDAASPRLSAAAVGAVAAGCAALAALAVGIVPTPEPRAPRRGRRGAAIAAAALLVLACAAVAARSAATEPRASYYHVAWHDQVLAHPALGTGAGTFGHYWAGAGKQLARGGALDAHSLYLETLAELGPIGLVVLAAFLLAPLRGAVRRRRAPYVPAALGAYAAFLVHAGLDWDWELPAVVVAALCCAAAVAAAGLRPQAPLPGRARAALLVAALALGGCAVAGARSTTVPAAAPQTTEAPRRGASVGTRVPDGSA